MEHWHIEKSDPMDPKSAGIVNKGLQASREVSVEGDADAMPASLFLEFQRTDLVKTGDSLNFQGILSVKDQSLDVRRTHVC